MTTREEIAQWFDRGVERGATHMLVICDTFDWEDYPSYVSSADDARKKVNSPGSMQKVMEIYDLSKDRDAQLNELRARNI